MNRILTLFFVIALALASSARAQAPTVGEEETGLAAVYADSLDGHVTASGQIYDKTKLTAAHKTLPFGTKIKITNTKNNRSVVLRVNDRGPVQTGRIVDISPAAAERLHMGANTTHEVTLEVLELGNGKSTKQRAK
jgi:rare lipoprotein A